MDYIDATLFFIRQQGESSCRPINPPMSVVSDDAVDSETVCKRVALTLAPPVLVLRHVESVVGINKEEARLATTKIVRGTPGEQATNRARARTRIPVR